MGLDVFPPSPPEEEAEGEGGEGWREPEYEVLEAGVLLPIVQLNLNEPARLDPDSDYDFS